MKKCLAVLLALVLTLSFLTFTVSADDMEITPYAYACSACRNVMEHVEYNDVKGLFIVESCPASDVRHLHYDLFNESYWVCTTDGCIARDNIVRRNRVYTAYDVCVDCE